ncbi:similar to Saccharomyces cerevisiae YJL036W SNX4 Sorting nexin [Maudiozyma saulgeensis]|uniref:Sorting nexin-4 n=1 Tax=Maudiozyma saulgeensis TaxID=1789683 RepID=A0A1X7R5T3_9SACH|nr:similar to Saccharomyces cerevisiae YJL036W SNX4 Sorting nexin [Kazachstania saulgeensis]
MEQINKDSMKADQQKDFNMEITVSDPQKRTGEGGTSTAYVSYQISTKTDNPGYHDGKFNMNDIIVVHRRYSDLLLLHDVLANDYPTCIIPPLPDKKVFQYIAGDRFSQRFTQKRSHSLQNFLRRISLHPTLSQSSILKMFLTSNDWDTYRRSLIDNLPSNKEEVTDAFMNAFKSVNIQNDEFIEIKERSDKLDHTITKLDKIFHKVVKKNDSISEDYVKLGTALQELSELVTGENDELAKNLKIFQEGIIQLSYLINDLNKYLDYDYLVDLKDMEHYIESMRQLIKLKDQKQIDYEELNEYLTKSIKEKDDLIAGYGGSNFFTNKLEELAGISQEASRRDKITKLEERITSLDGELENARKIADGFEQETLKEIAQFENVKAKELKDTLGELADENIKFYEKMLQTWTKVDESLV